MKYLNELELPARKPPKGSRYAVAIADPKTKQEVVITSDERLVAFALDDEQRRWWLEGEPHTDAVLIAVWKDAPVVVAVELTASVQLKIRSGRVVGDPMVRKERQLDGFIEHFHPRGRTGGGDRTQGDLHHDAWRDGEDRLPIMPGTSHRVGALIIGFHQSARVPLGPKDFGGRTVHRAVWSPVPSARNRATIAFTDIASQLGW